MHHPQGLAGVAGHGVGALDLNFAAKTSEKTPRVAPVLPFIDTISESDRCAPASSGTQCIAFTGQEGIRAALALDVPHRNQRSPAY